MLESFFQSFRTSIIGHDLKSVNDNKSIVYADWTASGRLYAPIEKYLVNQIGPYVANPHTENNEMGRIINSAYSDARRTIKSHVNANDNDVLICTGAGATSAIIKLQRLMGLKVVERDTKDSIFQKLITPFVKKKANKPVVFVSHMEHHSNQTSWNECNVDVVVIAKGLNGQPCERDLQQKLIEFAERPTLIGAFTACSNVTGIKTDVHKLARMMHQAGGVCFIDYACSAPYVDIDMHPEDPLERLDGIYFSPHKFLGGPGACGILIFNAEFYSLKDCAPDKPGGGTVLWTNPWGQQAYFSNIEKREDGGTPAFLQTMKAAAAIKLKEKMTVANITKREAYLRDILMEGIGSIPDAKILEADVKERLCIVAFYFENVHYNLIIRLLNDKFAIQARGGCSCAGTYGHILLGVDQQKSAKITDQLNQGNLSAKPGWVRVSLHPTNTDEEAFYIVDSLKSIASNIEEWSKEYRFNPSTGDFEYLKASHTSTEEARLKNLLWAS